MKILQVNSFYYDRGGDCTHMFATSKLLDRHGHAVVPFAMKHPLNFKNAYAKDWPSYIDFKEELKKKSLGSALKVVIRTIYSFESKRCIRKLLDKEKPDIVHIHNILHHITPSILGEIKKRKIPIVWTLHDYTIICPNTSLLTEKGVVCEACKKLRFFMAPVKRCKKDSLAASTAAMLENYTHRLMNVYRHVDRFIAPSDFLRKKFIEFGMGEKVVTLNNFIDVDSVTPNFNNDGYYIYLGRLTHIKGVDTLVNAARKIPNVRLKIVGDGELLENFKNEDIPNIDFVGFKSGEELHDLIANAMFVVVPSQWYENFSYSILEAFAYGKPVIGARIGGIPEMVVDGETGYLFEAGNAKDLHSKIQKLVGQPSKIEKMGRVARQKVERSWNADIHYNKLMRIYESVMR